MLSHSDMPSFFRASCIFTRLRQTESLRPQHGHGPVEDDTHITAAGQAALRESGTHRARQVLSDVHQTRN